MIPSFDYYFQIISLVTAVFLYIRKRDKIPLYFIPFLFTTVGVESFAMFGTFPESFRKMAMYNVFTTLEFLFYSFLFYTHFRKPFFKKMVLIFVPLFVLAVIINLSFIQGLNKT